MVPRTVGAAKERGCHCLLRTCGREYYEKKTLILQQQLSKANKWQQTALQVKRRGQKLRDRMEVSAPVFARHSGFLLPPAAIAIAWWAARLTPIPVGGGGLPVPGREVPPPQRGAPGHSQLTKVPA